MSLQLGFDFDAPATAPAPVALPPLVLGPGDEVRAYWWVTQGGKKGDWWRALPQEERERLIRVYQRSEQVKDGEERPDVETEINRNPYSYRVHRNQALRWAMDIKEARKEKREPVIDVPDRLQWVFRWAQGWAER